MSAQQIRDWIQQFPICLYCQQPIKTKDYSVDHITPLGRGGLNTFDNLQLICNSCNRTKGDLSHQEFCMLLFFLEQEMTSEGAANVKKRLKAGSGFIYGH